MRIIYRSNFVRTMELEKRRYLSVDETATLIDQKSNSKMDKVNSLQGRIFLSLGSGCTSVTI